MKKIKDYKIKELNKICFDNQITNEACSKCPLNDGVAYCIGELIAKLSTEYLEKEVKQR